MHVLGWSDGHGGVYHYRIKEPLRGLLLLGHDTRSDQALQLKLADRYDVILVRALHNRHESKGWHALAAQGKHLLVYDLDDDIWSWMPDSDSARYWNDERRFRVEVNIQLADLVTTPSFELAKMLGHLNPRIYVLPNTVPRWLTNLQPARRDPNAFIIGWEGAHQHIRDLRIIYTPVFRFMMRHPDVVLHLWGPDRFEELPGELAGRVKCFGWQSDVPTYYRSLAMDVCLAPLENVPFNTTKSGIRVQEHSALGIPVIASPSPAYSGFLMDGQNGYLAVSPQAWETALERLYRNRGLGPKLGAAGRRLAKHWTTEDQAKVRELIYERGLRERGRTRAEANRRAGEKPANAETARARAEAGTALPQAGASQARAGGASNGRV